jgi:hypothetical protein
LKIENNEEFIMKNLLKVFTILALVALLFTACGEKTTVYTAQTGYQGVTVQFIFNGDGTFVERSVITILDSTTITDWYKGTYSGDPKKDGPLSLTFTHEFDDDSNAYVAMTSVTVPVTVNNGQFTFGTYTFSRN